MTDLGSVVVSLDRARHHDWRAAPLATSATTTNTVACDATPIQRVVSCVAARTIAIYALFLDNLQEGLFQPVLCFGVLIVLEEEPVVLRFLGI